MDRDLSLRSVNIDPVVATPHHLSDRYGTAPAAFHLDDAFRIFVSCQLAAAVGTMPGKWIPGIFILIHF